MAQSQIVQVTLGTPVSGATHFNLEWSQDGGTTWVPYSTTSATPSAPEDEPVGLLTAGVYTLDGVNSPSGNMALASLEGNVYRARWKVSGAYGNWSAAFGVFQTTDAIGWPTIPSERDKILISAPDGLTEALTSDIQALLDAVIAEVEGPIGEGGCGRSFTPITETRLFDGNGFPELRVPDIVPGTALLVKSYDAVLVDVLLAQPVQPYLGHNRLVRPQGAGSILGASYALPGIFPGGSQNISVETTWGFAATVPRDLSEAVRGEVAARALVQGAIPLTGVGEAVGIGSFNINTSSGISVWKLSSPIAVLHTNYQNVVARYRNRGAWARALLVRRMA